jgi:hypothetical protein
MTGAVLPIVIYATCSQQVDSRSASPPLAERFGHSPSRGATGGVSGRLARRRLWPPYLNRELGDAVDARAERALIEGGAIQATGFRYVGKVDDERF